MNFITGISKNNGKDLLLPWEPSCVLHFMACKQILLQFVVRVGNISLFLWFKFVEKQFRRWNNMFVGIDLIRINTTFTSWKGQTFPLFQNLVPRALCRYTLGTMLTVSWYKNFIKSCVRMSSFLIGFSLEQNLNNMSSRIFVSQIIFFKTTLP